MDSNEIACVKAFIAAINQGNTAGLSGLMAEDYTFINSMGEAESGRGDAWAEFFRLFPDYKMEVESMIREENVVGVFGSVSGTYNGNRGLIPENRIEMPAAWKAIVENGKVKHLSVYADWTEAWKVIEEDKKQG